MSIRPNTPTDDQPSPSVAITAKGWLITHLGPAKGQQAWQALEEYCRLVLRNDPDGKDATPALIFDGKGGIVAGVKINKNTPHDHN